MIEINQTYFMYFKNIVCKKSGCCPPVLSPLVKRFSVIWLFSCVVFAFTSISPNIMLWQRWLVVHQYLFFSSNEWKFSGAHSHPWEDYNAQLSLKLSLVMWSISWGIERKCMENFQVMARRGKKCHSIFFSYCICLLKKATL